MSNRDFSSSAVVIPEMGCRLVATKMGHPKDVVTLKEFSVAAPSTSDDDKILIELVAAPINYADLLIIRGYYGKAPKKFPLNIGFEGAFRVVSVGKNTAIVKVGDFVIPRNYELGTYSSHIVVSESDVFKLPPSVDLISCSMLNVNVFTAYRMLHDFVSLKKGDIVVQNGATSHVGQSVIQICKWLGVRTINIVRQSATSPTANALHQMGSDAIIEQTDPDKCDMGAINKQLASYGWYDPKKVVLGLNCIGGSYFTIVDSLLADSSPLVTYGGIYKRNIDPSISSLIFRDIRYCGFSMGDWMAKNASGNSYKKMCDDVFEVLMSENYTRPPFQCFPLSDFKTAFEKFNPTENHVLPKRLLLTNKFSYLEENPTHCLKP